VAVNRTLFIAIWSIAMFAAGWHTHVDHVAGKPIFFDLMITGVIWLFIIGKQK
jgi:hypothetical protein